MLRWELTPYVQFNNISFFPSVSLMRRSSLRPLNSPLLKSPMSPRVRSIKKLEGITFYYRDVSCVREKFLQRRFVWIRSSSSRWLLPKDHVPMSFLKDLKIIWLFPEKSLQEKKVSLQSMYVTHDSVTNKKRFVSHLRSTLEYDLTSGLLLSPWTNRQIQR